MDEPLQTKSNKEEEIDIHRFVEEYIRRDIIQGAIENFECILDETGTAFLEITSIDPGEVTRNMFTCIKCDEVDIGEEEVGVFQHIKDDHPSVTGLVIEPKEDQDEFEDV